ncbi:hypothetical protein FPV67DRAFT_1452956 [Lyophyllum atratum]|nr:hypothetical protein FPV67DRAFT_1452956 [Lyophyllum atratum]
MPGVAPLQFIVPRGELLFHNHHDFTGPSGMIVYVQDTWPEVQETQLRFGNSIEVFLGPNENMEQLGFRGLVAPTGKDPKSTGPQPQTTGPAVAVAADFPGQRLQSLGNRVLAATGDNRTTTNSASITPGKPSVAGPEAQKDDIEGTAGRGGTQGRPQLGESREETVRSMPLHALKPGFAHHITRRHPVQPPTNTIASAAGDSVVVGHNRSRLTVDRLRPSPVATGFGRQLCFPCKFADRLRLRLRPKWAENRTQPDFESLGAIDWVSTLGFLTSIQSNRAPTSGLFELKDGDSLFRKNLENPCNNQRDLIPENDVVLGWVANESA